MRASQAQSYGLSAFLRRPQPRSKERDIERTRTPENPAMISGLSWQGALTADPPLRMSSIRGSPRDRSSTALSLDLLPGPGPELISSGSWACDLAHSAGCRRPSWRGGCAGLWDACRRRCRACGRGSTGSRAVHPLCMTTLRRLLSRLLEWFRPPPVPPKRPRWGGGSSWGSGGCWGRAERPKPEP